MTDAPAPVRAEGVVPSEPANVEVPRSRLSLGCLVLLIVGGSTLTVILGLTTVAFAWRAGHQAAIAEECARLRALGKPTTLAQLNASYTVDPDRPDATGAWLEAFETVHGKDVSDNWWTMNRSLFRDDGRLNRDVTDDGSLGTVLAEHASIFEAIERAAAVGSNVRFPTDYERGIDTAIDHIVPAREIVRWLGLRVGLAIRERRYDDAIADIERQLVLGDTLVSEPNLSVQLVRLALHGVAFANVETLLIDQRLTREQLDRLDQRLRTLDLRSGLDTAINGERAMSVDFMAHGDLNVTGDSGTVQIYGETPLAIADQRFILEFYRQLETAAGEEDPVAMARGLKEANTLLEQRAAESIVPPYLVQAITPSGEMIGEPFIRAEASRRLLITGIAARRHQLRTGHLPRAPEELSADLPGGLPVDPYDGRPIRLLPVTDPSGPPRHAMSEDVFGPVGPGLAIYGVGRNRVDEGGLYDHAVGAYADQVLFLPETMDPDRLFASSKAQAETGDMPTSPADAKSD